MAIRDRRDTPDLTRRTTSGSPATRDPYGSSAGSWPDPWSQIRRLTDQMDRWFDAVGFGRTNSRWSGPNENPWAGMWAPEMETFLRNDQFIVRMDLPGMTKDEVNVEVTDESVIIQGERQNLNEETRDGFYRSERNYGRFYREVQLPEGAQPETAKANYKDGVLEISVTAPPRQLRGSRRVEIGSSTTTEKEARQRAAANATTDATTMQVKDRTTHPDRASIAHDRGNE